MDIPNNFVAIDFETMTAEHTSACAVGLVKVVEGVIIQEFYTLINPIPDNRDKVNTFVHGITKEQTALAPTFADLYPPIMAMIGDLPIACHNKGSDITILEACMQHNNLRGINTSNHICTFELTGLSLPDACAKYGIEMGCHHNALDDARACAKILTALQGKIHADTFKFDKRDIKSFMGRKVSKELLTQLSDSEIANQDTIFFHSTVVITGTFDAYPDRNQLASNLRSLGADINTSISKNTKIVVLGKGAGPSKVKKIEELQSAGYEIRIIREAELIELLSSGR